MNKQEDGWNEEGGILCSDEKNVVPTRNDRFVCLEVIDDKD